MLLPHSQDKPIHFRIPVWVFLVMFLSMFTLLGMTMFFSYSSYQLKNVADQKRILETELSQMEAEKARWRAPVQGSADIRQRSLTR